MNSIILKIVFCFLISAISTGFYLAFQKTRKSVKTVMFLLIFISHIIVFLPVKGDFEYLLGLMQIIGEFIILMVFSNENTVKKLLRYVELNLATGIGMAAGYMVLYIDYKFIADVKDEITSGDIFSHSGFNEQMIFYMTTAGVTSALCYGIYLYRKKEDSDNYRGRETTVCMCVGMLFILCSAGLLLTDGKNQWKSYAIYIFLGFMAWALFTLDRVNRNIRIKEKLKAKEFVLEKQQETAGKLSRKFESAANELALRQKSMEEELNAIYEKLGRDGRVLSNVIENKKIKAGEKGLTLLVTAKYKDVLMSGEDQVSIVGNLLDNAIEAASKPEVEDKTIKVFLKANGNEFEMTVENEFDGNVKHHGDVFETTKKGSGHGLGLMHVKKILQKYNKELIVDIQQNRFTAVIKAIFMALAFMWAFSCDKNAYADENITRESFGDDVFYDMVLEAADDNGDGILQISEAENYTSVNYLSTGEGENVIKNISGLKYLPNITSLIIRGDGVIINLEGFDALNELQNLVIVQIDNTNISGADFLHNNPKLRSLIINNEEGARNFVTCPISDVSGIANCPELEFVSFGNLPNLKDISGLSNSQNIWAVQLVNTSISDLSPLMSSAETLQRVLLSNCGSLSNQSMTLINNFVNLEQFELVSCYMDEIPDLTNLTKLTSVTIFGNNFSDEELLKNLPPQILEQEVWQQRARDVESSKAAEQNSSQNNSGVINTPDENNTSGDIQGESNGNLEDEDADIISNESGDIFVKGKFEPGAFLEAKELNYKDMASYSGFIELVESMVNDEKVMRFYDISVYKYVAENNTQVKVKLQPDGGAWVTIKIENAENVRYRVFRREEDGSVVELSIETSEEGITFYSEHFSIFSVVITKIFDSGETDYEISGEAEMEDRGGSDNKKEISVLQIVIIIIAIVSVLSVISAYEIYRWNIRKKKK